MNKEITTTLKEDLLEKKKHLEQELSSLAEKDPKIKGDWNAKMPRVPEGNLEEAADEVEEYTTNLHIEFSLEKQLQDVDAALERIKKGTYGKCEKCKKNINLERLKASPEATTCIDCKA
ncbi:MAG: TraR/DksA family transcriptional regulator [Patescibacteria group bacterium]|nr:TraR/DksA family transcriptional regulator [Patescibacteria group bacterium]